MLEEQMDIKGENDKFSESNKSRNPNKEKSIKIKNVNWRLKETQKVLSGFKSKMFLIGKWTHRKELIQNINFSRNFPNITKSSCTIKGNNISKNLLNETRQIIYS